MQSSYLCTPQNVSHHIILWTHTCSHAHIDSTDISSHLHSHTTHFHAICGHTYTHVHTCTNTAHTYHHTYMHINHSHPHVPVITCNHINWKHMCTQPAHTTHWCAHTFGCPAPKLNHADNHTWGVRPRTPWDKTLQSLPRDGLTDPQYTREA